MTSSVTTLRELEIGKTATVVSVGGEGALRQHFLDMGLIPETDVTMVKYAPMGDPVEVRLHGYAREVLSKLPMEFAVEAQKLLQVSLEGSVG